LNNILTNIVKIRFQLHIKINFTGRLLIKRFDDGLLTKPEDVTWKTVCAFYKAVIYCNI